MREVGLVTEVRVRTQGDNNIKRSERKTAREPWGQQGCSRGPRERGGPGPEQRLFPRTAHSRCWTLTRIKAEWGLATLPHCGCYAWEAGTETQTQRQPGGEAGSGLSLPWRRRGELYLPRWEGGLCPPSPSQSPEGLSQHSSGRTVRSFSEMVQCQHLNISSCIHITLLGPEKEVETDVRDSFP